MLPVLLVVGLTVYSAVSVLQADGDAVRTLPKWGWLAVVLLLPLVGAVAYLLAGRPVRGTAGPAGGVRGYRPGPKGPDDDEDFLRGL
ncbi:PLDc N-terminal domain-containing protein [Kineococcus gypseus]|uniref:PLDc N-terminal domain-containing protein n=1 Tax=Kineococcus gypseus TaxID=1637102 RepID=UPI003D7DBCB3